jgi:hypothetical protein
MRKLFILILASLVICGCDSYDVVTTKIGNFERTEKVDKKTGAATHVYVPSIGWKSYKEASASQQLSGYDCQKIERPCRPGDPEYHDYGDMNDLAAKYVKCYDYVGNCPDK